MIVIKSWKFIRRKTVFDHPRLTLFEDIVLLPTNKEISYLREKPTEIDSVAVIAINEKGELLLQSEYSYPVEKVMYQLPGGSMNKGETVIEAANRELSEESNLVGKQSETIGAFYINNRRSDRKQHIVVLRDLAQLKGRADPEEFIMSEWHTIENIYDMIKQGKIDNSTLLAALCIFERTNVPI